MKKEKAKKRLVVKEISSRQTPGILVLIMLIEIENNTRPKIKFVNGFARILYIHFCLKTALIDKV